MKRTMRALGLASLVALVCAALPARGDEDSEAAMRQPPAAAQWSQRVGAGEATRAGANGGPIGGGASDTLNNGSNANVGNSTAAAATERLPEVGTPRRR